jgi:hypothetical protein
MAKMLSKADSILAAQSIDVHLSLLKFEVKARKDISGKELSEAQIDERLVRIDNLEAIKAHLEE